MTDSAGAIIAALQQGRMTLPEARSRYWQLTGKDILNAIPDLVFTPKQKGRIGEMGAPPPTGVGKGRALSSMGPPPPTGIGDTMPHEANDALTNAYTPHGADYEDIPPMPRAGPPTGPGIPPATMGSAPPGGAGLPDMARFSRTGAPPSGPGLGIPPDMAPPTGVGRPTEIRHRDGPMRPLPSIAQIKSWLQSTIGPPDPSLSRSATGGGEPPAVNGFDPYGVGDALSAAGLGGPPPSPAAVAAAKAPPSAPIDLTVPDMPGEPSGVVAKAPRASVGGGGGGGGGGGSASGSGGATKSQLAQMELAAPEHNTGQPMDLAAMAQAKISKDAKKDGTPDWALPLVMAGLSMAASRNPSVLGAAAEGGMEGVRTLMVNRQQNRQDAQLQRQIDQGDRGLSIQEQNANEAIRAHDASYRLQEQQLSDNRKYHEDYTTALMARAQRVGSGSNRAPSRPEVYAQLVNVYAKQGLRGAALDKAVSKHMQDIFGKGGVDPRSQAAYYGLSPEDRASMDAAYNGDDAAADPTDAFFTPPPDDSLDFSP